MSAAVVQANALRLPLRDESVDLIITSPPYFALRSYRDGGSHYAGQIGSEPTPAAFLEALWTFMSECWRVLKPSGSCFVNLGDKRSGSGGHNNSGIARTSGTAIGSTLEGRPQQISNRATRRNAPDRYNQAAMGRPKSKMLLPHRFAEGCEDGLADPCIKDHEHVGRHPAYLPTEQCCGRGWVVRQDVVWSKLNGMPEPATDRCRDSHEYVFHLTKSEQYFAAIDEVRDPHAEKSFTVSTMPVRGDGTESAGGRFNTWLADSGNGRQLNPLGRAPGSVWEFSSERLPLSDEIRTYYGLPDHFAAFPTELPRRIILGWSPSGICTICNQGRRPVVQEQHDSQGRNTNGRNSRSRRHESPGRDVRTVKTAAITGYACSCPSPDAPTRPAVVCDPFSGTGTVVGVARALGRFGVGFDLSHDYCRLGQWFLDEGRARFIKVANRTDAERQGVLL